MPANKVGGNRQYDPVEIEDLIRRRGLRGEMLPFR